MKRITLTQMWKAVNIGTPSRELHWEKWEKNDNKI